MLQAPNAHMTHSSNNIIEPVNGEELQKITGGCLGCGVVTIASAAELGTSLAKAQNAAMAGSIKEATREGTKALVHGRIVLDSANNFSLARRPCQNCMNNIKLYLTTKGA